MVTLDPAAQPGQTATIRITVKCDSSGGDVCHTQDATLTIVGVESLEWDEFASNSTPLTTCPNNGGTRIFPGRRFVVDADPTIRDKINLVATLKPPLEGITVYFSNWDVDDPFDQDNAATFDYDHDGTVDDVTAIDGDTSGPDNDLPGGGSDPGVGQWSAVSDANGIATIPITVSMQPGNNYRGTASCDQNKLNATTQADADTNSPPAGVVASEMLTVWRKVWLELDSMAKGSDISYTEEMFTKTDDDPHAGDGRATMSYPDIDDDGRFEGGTLKMVTGGPPYNTYTVIDNIDDLLADSYYTSTLIADGDVGWNATVKDDDTAVLPHTPDANITVLNSKYKNCYIEFMENSGTREDNNIFVATIAAHPDIVADKGLENNDLEPLWERWVSVIVTGYQSHDQAGPTLPKATPADGDPDRKYHVHASPPFERQGDTANMYGATPHPAARTDNVSIIYYETILDHNHQVSEGQWPGQQPYTASYHEARVIAHEIGHQFAIIPHTNGTLMSDWDGGDYDFDANQIDHIRGSQALSSHSN